MIKSDSEKKEVPEKELSQAQMTLIGELYEETNYTRRYCVEELASISRSAANKHIQMLKDLKSRQYQERKNHESGPVFDKIGFGMVYKLCWKACAEQGLATKPSKCDFIDHVIGEYKLFKETQEQARQFVADGGLE